MNERLRMQMAFLNEIEKLKVVYRRNGTIGNTRYENSAEHSWHVALMALVLAEHCDLESIDLSRVIQMLLIHDLVEIYAGDTWLYDEQAVAHQQSREAAAAQQLFGHLPADQASRFQSLWEEFECRQSIEAKYASAVDSLQPLTNHLLVFADAAPIEPRPTQNQVMARKLHIEEASATLWGLARDIIQESTDKGLYSIDVSTQIRTAMAALPKQDTPSLRAVRRHWSRALKEISGAEMIAIARALEPRLEQNRKWLAFELLRFHRRAFEALTEAQIADFAERIASWYATDAFGTILAGPLWAKGRISDSLIDAWSRSDDRWLRRSALVATVGRNGVNPHAPSTLSICRRLADDGDDMVEKAVSWALRYLSQKEPDTVSLFMADCGDQFRPRVRREVRNKLTTGLKNPRPNALSTASRTSRNPR